MRQIGVLFDWHKSPANFALVSESTKEACAREKERKSLLFAPYNLICPV